MANYNSQESESKEPNYPSSYPGNYPEPLGGGEGDVARDMQRMWFLILEKLWLIAIIMVVFLIVAAIYISTAKRVYEATATVQVEDQDQTAIKPTDQPLNDEQRGQEMLNTIVEKFQSRPLCAMVLAQAGLIPSNTLDIISFTTKSGGDDSSDASGLDSASGPDAAATNLANPAASNSMAASAPGTNSGLDANATIAMLGNPDVMIALKRVAGFEKRVFAKLRRNTRLIDITVSDADPNQAAKLANLMVENYLTQDFKIQSTTGHSESEFFEAEYKRLEKKLSESEQALQDYREQVGTVEMQNMDNNSANPQTDEIEEYKRQLTEAQADEIRLKAAYDESLKMGTNVDELLAYTSISSDPQVQLIQTAVAQKEADLLQLKQLYREKNPKYILAVKTLDGLKSQLTSVVLDIRSRIQESFRLPYENALTTEKGLQTELAKVQTKSLDLSQKAIKYNLLAREVASDEAMFDSVLERLKETSVSSELAPVNISVVEAAYPADKPSSPKVTMILALAIIASLGLGVGFVVVMDKFNTSLRTVDSAEEFLQMPVLGAIPQLGIDSNDYKNNLVVASKDTHSAEVELFRTLRASISMLNKDKEHRSFLFTSSFPKEGKSFTSCNFAASLAQQGLRTIIFDLDLRRPRVEEFLTGKNGHLPGLTEILQGKLTLKEVLQIHPVVENLFWVPAGAMIPNPSELLSQGGYQKLLEQTLKEFDRVVIDTSPLHPVKDALLVAGDVSTVIVLVNGSKTARKAVAKTIHWLKNVNAPVAGVVLNLLPRKRKGQGYYYYEYYGYSYGKYGRDDKKTKPARESASRK